MTLTATFDRFWPINTVLDCYTQAPISKFDLLAELQQQFGLYLFRIYFVSHSD
jgi:hypothetical protein